ncbi:NACHT domain-containing protein [Actinoplanes sp. NPDC049265]|uniref:NACHT domain-containing protein n=1 Tax=Actinoplanes sp. NPDC049265 TaxID=3363902 RepID=UPI003710DA85
MSTAERVRQLRKDRGWSAQRLAEECARYGPPWLSRGTIAKIESGIRKSVTTDDLTVLARAFGVEPTALLTETGSDLPALIAPQPITPDRGEMLVRSLALAHRAALSRPLVESSFLDDDVTVPTAKESYLEPRFRLGAGGADSAMASEQWWRELPLRDDISAFMAAWLALPSSTQAPLIVLGSPGAGKSMLTEVMAARLPAETYVSVVVKLRHVPPDGTIQDQIEHAIFADTGERTAWPDFSRAIAGKHPVILLDGLDEQLRATGFPRSRYLREVTDFQRREDALDRPVSVLVTCRTVAFERFRMPAETTAIRLEPFDDDRVRAWVDVWNRVNPHRRASAEALLRSWPGLANEPLLLLLLAISAPASGIRAEFYRRLLFAAARRETAKSDTPNDSDRAVRSVQRDLAVVAFAMLNRRAGHVRHGDLEQDLRSLGSAASVTKPEPVINTFFFTMEHPAPMGPAYEFLHSSFAEYLVASHALEILDDVARQMLADRMFSVDPDDGYLRSLLSFATLSHWPGVTGFLTELTREWPADGRMTIRETLLALLRRAPYRESQDTDYRPVDAPITTRIANYTANLTLLLSCVGGGLSPDDLFPDAADPADRWEREVLFWRSQLPAEDVESLLRAIQPSSRS